MSNNNNLLILDEPTNHLDLKSRDVLLKALKEFEGTVMYVSHDRHFLHGLSNRVFEVDKGGIRVFDSNFQYFWVPAFTRFLYLGIGQNCRPASCIR